MNKEITAWTDFKDPIKERGKFMSTRNVIEKLEYVLFNIGLNSKGVKAEIRIMFAKLYKIYLNSRHDTFPDTALENFFKYLFELAWEEGYISMEEYKDPSLIHKNIEEGK